MGFLLSSVANSSGLMGGPMSAQAGLVGTGAHWQVRVFAIIWLVGMLLIVLHALTHPALLRRRLRALSAEPEPRQRVIVSLLMLAVLALFVVSLLDVERGWSHNSVAIPVIILGDLIVAFGLVLVYLVFRVNEFAAATVSVDPGQTVISTGPYAFVRHPMYSAGLLLFLGSPLALGSWWGLLLFPPILVLVIWRLLDEERYLSMHLLGYLDYCAKVTYRLIPHIW